ncbi:hypothetical protein T492DRAFT_963020 [Pavlovales sp. CCMP2436]|nr:hypothetical protein T492DRAFT_963020 [Pavlovales sp. CCMP2436]
MAAGSVLLTGQWQVAQRRHRTALGAASSRQPSIHSQLPATASPSSARLSVPVATSGRHLASPGEFGGAFSGSSEPTLAALWRAEGGGYKHKAKWTRYIWAKVGYFFGGQNKRVH